MLIARRRGWQIPERLVTPENVFLNRRQLMVGSGAGAATIALGADLAFAAEEADPTAHLYPVPRNEAFEAGRPVTEQRYVETYNNYYEFGSNKTISAEAQNLPIRPWEIVIDGEVEKPFTIGIDELIAKMPLEERVYRHRCVEAWAMVVPWSGFQMSHLLDLARPLSAAKYVRMETFFDPEVARGQRPPLISWGGQLPWPYVEGLTMEEAANELTFLVTGAYGTPAAKQLGAPIRLHTPWKYGFKSIKGIVKFSFTREQPVNFWQEIQPSEYGFWANVNPEVPHPRWSQAEERMLGTNETVPTVLYNGYGSYVADLYKGLDGEALFM